MSLSLTIYNFRFEGYYQNYIILPCKVTPKNSNITDLSPTLTLFSLQFIEIQVMIVISH